MSDAEATFYDIGHGITEKDASQMFGKKCFEVCKGGKPFVSFFEECMVCKLLGDDHAQAVALDGANLFDPVGQRARDERMGASASHSSSALATLCRCVTSVCVNVLN